LAAPSWSTRRVRNAKAAEEAVAGAGAMAEEAVAAVVVTEVAAVAVAVVDAADMAAAATGKFLSRILFVSGRFIPGPAG
jgi:hypothetical protein